MGCRSSRGFFSKLPPDHERMKPEVVLDYCFRMEDMHISARPESADVLVDGRAGPRRCMYTAGRMEDRMYADSRGGRERTQRSFASLERRSLQGRKELEGGRSRS